MSEDDSQVGYYVLFSHYPPEEKIRRIKGDEAPYPYRERFFKNYWLAYAFAIKENLKFR